MSHTAPQAEHEIPLASWTQTIQHSALQEMLKAAADPSVLSFALGLPAAELFPAAAYSKALAHVLATDAVALQYQPPLRALKRQVLKLMAARGVTCLEEQIFLTAGAQQGVNLLVRLLLEAGGQVLTEECSYPGFLQVLQPYQPDILTVPTDPETGMDVERVAELLASGTRPAFIYAVADGHNPLAASMSRAKRERLVQLARQHSVPIIEDDPYGFLHYDGELLPPLRAFDERWVFYVGTFSKILAPGTRTGWLVVPEELTHHLAIVKESTDINMSPLNQRAINALLETDYLDGHLLKLREEYRTRRDTMLDALSRYFPSEARWQTPSSGLFIWVELPEQMDASRLLKLALEKEKIAFIPGSAFTADGKLRAPNCLRLNFSNSSPARIEEGIARLARVLKDY